MSRTVLALLVAGGIGLGAQGAGAFVWPSAPAKVARALQSGDVAERRAAALAIGEMDARTAASLLVKALGDSDVEVRLRAAKSAIRLRSAVALDAVIPWLSDSDVRVRLAACELIRHVPSPRAVVALGRVLGDPDAGVRLAAAAAMGASGASEAVGPLLGHLDDPSANVRAEVAQALAHIGDPTAAVPLIGKVGDSAPEVRRAVARALGELGDPRAGSALILALRDGVAQVRVDALTALGRLGSHEAVLAIAPLLEERGSPEVRVAALTALGKIASEPAIRTLIKGLATEDPAAKTSSVRDALEMSGAKAVGPLMAALEQYGSANVAAGAALVLGSMKAKGAGSAIMQAMRKGTLGAYAGLRALTELGDPATVPTVLELLSDSNPVVRRQAVLAVSALLDPSRRDGRAVEPLVAAMREPKTSVEEREQLARALGRTGAPRAIDVLLSLVKSKGLGLRLAAIDALGEMGPAGQDAPLLDALGDDNAGVRLHAALALGSSAGQASVGVLLERLTQAATEDRTAIGLALSGALSRSGEGTAKQLEKILFSTGSGVRDALVEGIGRMSGAAGGNLLATLVRRSSDVPDRRKIAEALAGHPEQFAVLRPLLSDPDGSVRAEAIWATTYLPRGPDASAALARALELISDGDLDVAANAVGAAALLGKTLSPTDPAAKSRAVAALCKATADFRVYVRANSLTGLNILGGRCDGGARERALLAQDPSEMVRQAAARLIARIPSTDATKADARALSRCVADDKSGIVANACQIAFPIPTSSSPALIFIVPDGRTSPAPLAAYSLQRADGLIRSGLADRRGAIFERACPKGEFRLVVPGALAY
ncbi:MAG TPA: HEAT repeat domain-containing protein [Polyangiaceae bacterium]